MIDQKHLLVQRIANELYQIRLKRNEPGTADSDWRQSEGIVAHFDNPDTQNWLWRYRDEDYRKWAELYEKCKNGYKADGGCN